MPLRHNRDTRARDRVIDNRHTNTKKLLRVQNNYNCLLWVVVPVKANYKSTLIDVCAANHTMSRLEDNNTKTNNNNDNPPKMNTTMGGKLPPPNSSQANNSTFVHCHNLLDKILINCSNDPVGNVHRTWSITLLMIAIYVIITIFQSTYLFLRVFSLRLCVHIYIYI